jgi:hypothetical protein
MIMSFCPLFVASLKNFIQVHQVRFLDVDGCQWALETRDICSTIAQTQYL